MKISKENALALWEEEYRNAEYTEDFNGGLMHKYAFGDSNYFIVRNGSRIYCGWNIHHIFPKACGSNNAIENVFCTNIITNEQTGDKVYYWIEGYLYQVKKIKETHSYQIQRLN